MAVITGIMKAAARAALKAVSFKYDWSFRQSYRYVRDILGYAYQRESMLSDFREWKGRSLNQYAVERFDPDRGLERRLFVERDFDRDRAYRVFGKATYRDTETGQTWTRYASMYVDHGTTLAKWQDDFLSLINEEKKSKGIEAVKFVIQSIVHHEGYWY